MTIYELEFDFIPYLISQFKKGAISKFALMNKEYWRVSVRQSDQKFTGFNFKDIIIEEKTISNEKSIIAIKFPEPQEFTEALFGLIFIDTTLNSADYFTLEISFPSSIYKTGEDDKAYKWMVGSQDYDLARHSNFGSYNSELTLDAFVEYCSKPFPPLF